LTRPSEAVDIVVRCLAEWPETGQTDTVLLILWLGVWQYGQKLVGLAAAVPSGEWCGEIEISWLVGWLAGRRFAERIMGAVLSDCCGRIPEWTQFREREHTKRDSEK